MTAREQLHAYIAQLEQRLRWGTVLRGFAILTVGALIATLALVTIANALAFSQGSVTAARFALIEHLEDGGAFGRRYPGTVVGDGNLHRFARAAAGRSG